MERENTGLLKFDICQSLNAKPWATSSIEYKQTLRIGGIIIALVAYLYFPHLNQMQQCGAQVGGQPDCRLSANGLALPTATTAKRTANEMRDFNLKFIVHTDNKGL